MTRILTRSVLIISGVLGIMIGGSLLFQPHAFFLTNGVDLGGDPNLLSEIRAPGGLLVAAGAMMITGAFRSKYMQQALQVALIVFGTYGLARMVSIMTDGIPSNTLLAALAVELLVSGYAVAALLKRKSLNTAKEDKIAHAY